MSNMQVIGTHSVVTISYTLRDGEDVLDTASLSQPLVFIQGTRAIVQGLENALEGRREGERFKVTLSPEEGYGRRRADRVRAVPREKFPPDLRLMPGMPFAIETVSDALDGDIWFVHEVWEDRVIMDGNHPLAGRTLTMDVRIISVRRATGEELEQGQAFARELDRMGWEL